MPQELQTGKTYVPEQMLVMRRVVPSCGEVEVRMVFC